jgi:hypothetical protein
MINLESCSKIYNDCGNSPIRAKHVCYFSGRIDPKPIDFPLGIIGLAGQVRAIGLKVGICGKFSGQLLQDSIVTGFNKQSLRHSGALAQGYESYFLKL